MYLCTLHKNLMANKILPQPKMTVALSIAKEHRQGTQIRYNMDIREHDNSLEAGQGDIQLGVYLSHICI